ncbi:FliH/SctL family protein [Qipengyuania qiaonensis]|uniref:Flagellar assembly protein FliH n=1 Tax=Qipengyuania qiaonensis TaxID=2867240 RepID=A0ABS7J5Y5_9SPHN|nr:FliH/SctL family protein [Qipengyuania qiaonensis]MBX7482750.1 hypothetical protein [Qipengyuania qiaonensis]
MTYRLFTTGEASALFGQSRIIPASETRELRKAGDVLEEAAAILAGAKSARAMAIVEGRNEARAQVLAERDTFAAGQLAPAIEKIAAAQKELREDIGRLAFMAIKHILGELDDDVSVAALARKAMDRMPVEAVERILVAPALAETVAARLPSEIAALVVADEALEPGDCVIEGSAGRVVASLELQLERLAERWQVGEAA